ncbi:MAG: hypothetical protein P8166_05965 [Candidatus Thiodiazotropha sp.]
MDVNLDLLPQSAQEWAEVIGLDGVLQLIDHFKGRQLKVPKRLDYSHPLARCLGPEKFVAFWKVYQGEPLTVPMIQAARRQLIWQAVNTALQSNTVGGVAARFNMTERNVYKIKARFRDEDDSQGELF